ncbi:hypothetical protein LOK49_LG07G01268 [Camellia lanceoleosa]|uniref:Uncharacterized protein n=1 Tax=Camellia lanceoleosa TaxID=1840588 RepID=A0ACC0H4J7_9ERIC|nr:hypothetical protein LOK49_LG07G01268 [Camellia lanceoleosa]
MDSSVSECISCSGMGSFLADAFTIASLGFLRSIADDGRQSLMRCSIRISELITIDPTNETQILKVVKQQPVTGGVLVTQEFSDLKGGIYEGSENYLRCEKERIGKHAILIVGFGYDEKYKKYY